MNYSYRERVCLWSIAALGGAGLNGIFAYSVFVDHTMIAATLANPLAMAFVVEALLLTGVLAYLLVKWQVTKLSRGWFVLLSLIGSLAFALPVAVLWRREA
jgi:hypothetical protein